MKKLFLHKNNFITKSFNKNKNKNRSNLSNINPLNYSNIQKFYTSRDTINTPNSNLRYKNNFSRNSMLYKYQLQSPNVSNYTKYVNMNNVSHRLDKFKSITTKSNISNASLISNTINQTYNNNANLMSMKINVRLLQQKLNDLNDIVIPSSKFNLTKKFFNTSNTFFNKNKQKSDDLNIFNNNISNDTDCQKYNHIRNYDLFTPRDDIKKKILNENENEINKSGNHRSININNVSNSIEKLKENKLNKNFKITKNDVIKAILNINKNNDNFLDSFNNKATENNSDDEELSNIADELVTTIKEKNNPEIIIDKNKEEIISDNNKIINKQTSINNNYIITNISGTVNYTPPVSKSPVKTYKEKIQNSNKKNEFVIFKNSFSINSINKEKDAQNTNAKINEGRENIKPLIISTKILEEEKQTQTENFYIIESDHHKSTIHNDNEDNICVKDNKNINDIDNMINNNNNDNNIINDKDNIINDNNNNEDNGQYFDMNVSSINYNNNRASNNNILSSNNDDLIIINNNLNYNQVTNEKSELSEISNPITIKDGNKYRGNSSN